MLYPKIEDCVAKVGCKYTLAIIIAKRGKELAVKRPAEFATSRRKELTYALNEIFNDQLTVKIGAGEE